MGSMTGDSGRGEACITGIIGAMESEVALIKEALADVRVTRVSGSEFFEGTLCGNRVVVCQCGVGKVHAAVCAEVLILAFGVTRIVNTGVAGSLTPELTIGDFVVSTEAVQHDFDISTLGFAYGEVPYTGKVAFEADPDLIAEAEAAVRQAAPSAQVLTGRVCSGDQFISSTEQTKTIVSRFGGLCCEMEGAAIAQVCYLNEVPFVIIRAISDGSDSTDFAQFQEEVARECASVVMALCGRA